MHYKLQPAIGDHMGYRTWCLTPIRKPSTLEVMAFFGVEGTSVQDPYHLARDRSVAGFDLTQCSFSQLHR